MYNQQKIIVVLPAYNAATTLEMTVRDIPDIVDEIILVDDKNFNAQTLSLGPYYFTHRSDVLTLGKRTME